MNSRVLIAQSGCSRTSVLLLVRRDLINFSEQTQQHGKGKKTANLVTSVTIILFENPFHQTSPSFKQIFFVEKQKQKQKKLSEDHDKTSK